LSGEVESLPRLDRWNAIADRAISAAVSPSLHKPFDGQTAPTLGMATIQLRAAIAPNDIVPQRKPEAINRSSTTVARLLGSRHLPEWVRPVAQDCKRKRALRGDAIASIVESRVPRIGLGCCRESSVPRPGLKQRAACIGRSNTRPSPRPGQKIVSDRIYRVETVVIHRRSARNAFPGLHAEYAANITTACKSPQSAESRGHALGINTPR
jgi:hypothetical protein